MIYKYAMDIYIIKALKPIKQAIVRAEKKGFFSEALIKKPFTIKPYPMKNHLLDDSLKRKVAWNYITNWR